MQHLPVLLLLLKIVFLGSAALVSYVLHSTSFLNKMYIGIIFCTFETKYRICCLWFYFFLYHPQAYPGGKGAMTPKFLAYLVILCFERRCPKHNTVARLKSKDFPPNKLWTGYAKGIILRSVSGNSKFNIISAFVRQLLQFKLFVSNWQEDWQIYRPTALSPIRCALS